MTVKKHFYFAALFGVKQELLEIECRALGLSLVMSQTMSARVVGRLSLWPLCNFFGHPDPCAASGPGYIARSKAETAAFSTGRRSTPLAGTIA